MLYFQSIFWCYLSNSPLMNGSPKSIYFHCYNQTSSFQYYLSCYLSNTYFNVIFPVCLSCYLSYHYFYVIIPIHLLMLSFQSILWCYLSNSSFHVTLSVHLFMLTFNLNWYLLLAHMPSTSMLVSRALCFFMWNKTS